VIDMPALIEPVDEWFSDMNNFRVLWAKRWKNAHEVINIKEARVALSSLKKSARVVSLHGCRKLTLSDNLAAVSASGKGRSGSPSMNLVCQQAAAISFGAGIVWRIRRIETKRNQIPLMNHHGGSKSRRLVLLRIWAFAFLSLQLKQELAVVSHGKPAVLANQVLRSLGKRSGLPRYIADTSLGFSLEVVD